jgi:ribulose kinase
MPRKVAGVLVGFCGAVLAGQSASHAGQAGHGLAAKHVVHHSGWADFVESAGIPYPGVKKRQNFWTKEKVLEEIRRWHSEGHAMHHRGLLTPTP